jgi:uncharacterized repeat protein (TIGR01451 family)
MKTKCLSDRKIRALLLTVLLLAAMLFLIAWTLPLVDNADATFVGKSSYDRAAERLAMVGDVNGDGYDDFVIGARHATVTVSQAGGAYLFLGNPATDWGPGFDLSLADATFGSAGYQDYTGRDVAGAGDVNGDGYDDFLIGASGYDASGTLTQTGKVYLILGRPAADWGTGFDLANADASFVGEAAYDHAGYALAGAGDVDGDHYDDFLVGAYQNDESGQDAGKVYLILGRHDADWGQNVSLSSADASFLGEADFDEAGISVAGVGDVNGDDLHDFLIGSGIQYAYLFLGRAAANWGQSLGVDNADAIFGGGAGDAVVAGAGDVNGDGLDDFLKGAIFDDEGGDNAGKVYLLLGREAADWGPSFDLANADASFYGAGDHESAGYALSGAGDVNRDGYDDFLVGAYQFDPGGTDTGTGRAYLVLGHPDGWHTGTDLADAATARDLWAFNGEVVGDEAGSDVAGGGDVNGDGFADFLVGAPENDDTNTSAGKAYLVLGRGLVLAKTANADAVAPGERITYTLRYTNTNPWGVQQVRIGDRIPAHTIYVGCNGGLACNHQGPLVFWNLGTVISQTTGTVGMIVAVPADVLAGTVITNTAWITAPSRVNPVFSTVTTRVEAPIFTVYLPLVLRATP